MARVAHPQRFHEIVIERDHLSGELVVRGVVPTWVAWSPELVCMLRVQPEQCRFASIEAGPGQVVGAIITLDVKPERLRYLLTGDLDLASGLVSRRIDDQGRWWHE